MLSTPPGPEVVNDTDESHLQLSRQKHHSRGDKSIGRAVLGVSPMKASVTQSVRERLTFNMEKKGAVTRY